MLLVWKYCLRNMGILPAFFSPPGKKSSPARCNFPRVWKKPAPPSGAAERNTRHRGPRSWLRSPRSGRSTSAYRCDARFASPAPPSVEFTRIAVLHKVLPCPARCPCYEPPRLWQRPGARRMLGGGQAGGQRPPGSVRPQTATIPSGAEPATPRVQPRRRRRAIGMFSRDPKGERSVGLAATPKASGCSFTR